ncbi:MAG: tannase/feruloyl esterase family alpha/beta hydrolase [Rhodothermales bacterium]
MRQTVFGISLIMLLLNAAPTASAQDACTGLTEARLPDVRITRAVRVESGEEEGVSAAHCAVDGVIGREIGFEVLLPDDWNGRFAMGGGGGFVGSVQNMLRPSVDRGYATAGTDTGHQGPGTSAAWALNQPERQVNFGHLAVHRTAEVAKALIYAYYGTDPDYSYFMGCSRGGGQALMEAQRYPDDFDGIVAGAPAFDWTGIGAEMVQNTQKAYPSPSDTDRPIVTRDQLAYLEGAILEECDGLDGVEDGVMEDPRACAFEIDALPRCPASSDDGVCFTTRQVEAIREIYAPPTNDDGPLFVGQPFGGEGWEPGWIAWITGGVPNPEEAFGRDVPSLHYAFGVDMYRYLVFNDPEWDYSTYDFSSWENDVAYAAAFLNATDPDLRDFEERGGKLLLYHGWSDAALSALASIDFYEDVEARDGSVREYFRMYLMPGVLHCSGGSGPDQVDWLGIIRDWVESGEAPDRVVASKADESGEVIRTRPLCPYPQRAAYTGSGSTDDAENFVCEAP